MAVSNLLSFSACYIIRKFVFNSTLVQWIAINIVIILIRRTFWPNSSGFSQSIVLHISPNYTMYLTGSCSVITHSCIPWTTECYDSEKGTQQHFVKQFQALKFNSTLSREKKKMPFWCWEWVSALQFRDDCPKSILIETCVLHQVWTCRGLTA